MVSVAECSWSWEYCSSPPMLLKLTLSQFVLHLSLSYHLNYAPIPTTSSPLTFHMVSSQVYYAAQKLTTNFDTPEAPKGSSSSTHPSSSTVCYVSTLGFNSPRTVYTDSVTSFSSISTLEFDSDTPNTSPLYAASGTPLSSISTLDLSGDGDTLLDTPHIGGTLSSGKFPNYSM